MTLGFHNDLPNNYARPDWVNILCLRSHKENLVSTTIVNNSDIVRQLDSTTLSVLGQEIFMTPHEVISVYGGKSMEGVVKKSNL